MHYWLFKSEPECFSLQDLVKTSNQTTSWDGVRNFQARNFMRSMRKGEQGFLYHSGKNPEIVGVLEIAAEAYVDHTAFDVSNEHHDPQSTPENPRWFMVDVRLVQAFDRPLARSVLRDEPELANMELMRKGSRLSVQPVEREAFEHIMRLANALRC